MSKEKAFKDLATGDILLGRKGVSGTILKARVLGTRAKKGKFACQLDFDKDGKYDRVLQLSEQEASLQEYKDSEGITWFIQENQYLPPAKTSKEVMDSDQMKEEIKKKEEEAAEEKKK